MSYFLSADEVFAIGVEIEKNGKAFYSAAADKANAIAAKKLFTELAQWEEKHVEIFENLKKNIGGEKMEDLFDPDEQLREYLKAAADNHVFVRGLSGAAAAAACKTPREALETALQFEKDSVIYYTAMQRVVPENSGGKDITRLIDEEMRHIVILSNKIKETH
jgi:rubrerythrin